MDWYCRQVVTELLAAQDLAAGLALRDRELISIVGGGGKTTTLFELGRQLPRRTVLTTTTKMGSDRTEDCHVVIDPTDAALGAALDAHNTVLTWKATGPKRADGFAPERCDHWFETGIADNLVVEADGSKRRPFKAPLSYEPVIPTGTTLVLACIGMTAIGAPIEQGCFRAETVAGLIGASVGDELSADMAALVLLDNAGSMKSVPATARFVVLAHQVTDDNRNDFDALVAALDDRVPVIGVAALS